MHRALLWLTAAMAACGRESPPAKPEPVANDEDSMTATQLEIAQRWDGTIREDGTGATVLAIRDADAYAAFVDRIPTERVQMKQPAPPSDDPLLARPAVDFGKDMIIAVVEGDTLERPAIARVTHDDARILVAYVPASHPPAAKPRGIGTYAAVLVPRADGELALAPPTVIEDAAAVAGAVGTLVTLRGELTRTKIPTILGVDVDEGSASPDQPAEATGWLESDTTTQAEIDERIARSGQYAHRGPGTTYRLVSPDGAGLARASPPRSY